MGAAVEISTQPPGQARTATRSEIREKHLNLVRAALAVQAVNLAQYGARPEELDILRRIALALGSQIIPRNLRPGSLVIPKGSRNRLNRTSSGEGGGGEGYSPLDGSGSLHIDTIPHTDTPQKDGVSPQSIPPDLQRLLADSLEAEIGPEAMREHAANVQAILQQVSLEAVNAEPRVFSREEVIRRVREGHARYSDFHFFLRNVGLTEEAAAKLFDRKVHTIRRWQSMAPSDLMPVKAARRLHDLAALGRYGIIERYWKGEGFKELKRQGGIVEYRFDVEVIRGESDRKAAYCYGLDPRELLYFRHWSPNQCRNAERMVRMREGKVSIPDLRKNYQVPKGVTSRTPVGCTIIHKPTGIRMMFGARSTFVLNRKACEARVAAKVRRHMLEEAEKARAARHLIAPSMPGTWDETVDALEVAIERAQRQPEDS